MKKLRSEFLTLVSSVGGSWVGSVEAIFVFQAKAHDDANPLSVA
jgi:hypothetical protein